MIYISLLLIVILLIYTLVYISNNCLIIKKYNIKNKKIPNEFDGFKIVHISDVHSKIFGKNNEKVIQKINKINPDVVLMSGDIVDKREKNIDRFINMYKDIYLNYPKFNNIMSQILLLEPEDKVRNNKELILAGLLANNLFYM